MSAICNACKQEMKPGVSCTLTHYEGEVQERVVYPLGEDSNCHDCNTPPGGLHHPGCDMERCPICKGQLITCSCPC